MQYLHAGVQFWYVSRFRICHRECTCYVLGPIRVYYSKVIQSVLSNKKAEGSCLPKRSIAPQHMFALLALSRWKQRPNKTMIARSNEVVLYAPPRWSRGTAIMTRLCATFLAVPPHALYTMESNPNRPFGRLWSKLGVLYAPIKDPKADSTTLRFGTLF